MPTPEYTTLHQDSSTVYDTLGNPKFRIVSTITYVRAGDLPDRQPEIFVFQIVSATDPKQDKFLRVASIHDLSQMVRGREPARASGKSYYLSSTFTVEYDDITTAISAKAVVQTRVDALISAWIDYSTKFIVPTDYTMPAPEPTLVTAAKNSYYAARTSNASKQTALNDAIAAVTDAQAAAARAAADLTAAIAASSDCSLMLTKISNFQAAYNGGVSPDYRNTMSSLVSAVTAAAEGVDPPPSYAPQLSVAKTAVEREIIVLTPLLADIVTTMTQKCTQLNIAVQTAAQAKTSADTAAAAAQTAQALAQAEATAASAAESAALAAVTAVCPDFDPNA